MKGFRGRGVIYIALLVILDGCTSLIQKKGLEIRGYRYNNDTKTEKTIFLFTEKDILCVDWANQSYKLKDSALDKLKEENFTGGYLNEFIRIIYNDSIVSEVNILNSYSSNHKYFNNSPYTCVYETTNNILTSDNWLVININGSKGSIYDKLFNKELFLNLQDKGLLTNAPWNCNTKNIENIVPVAPNKNFDLDFCRRFYSEKIAASNLRFLCHSSACNAFIDSVESSPTRPL